MQNISATAGLFDGEQELDVYIQQNHERILQRMLRLAASISETIVSKEDLEHYCNSIRAEYEEISNYVKKHFQGEVHRATGNIERTISDTEIDINEKRVHYLKEEARVMKLDRDKIEINYHWNHYPVIIATEGIIFFGDFLYNIFSFTVIGGSLLFAIPGALLFSISLAVGAFKIPVVLKNISNPRKRINTAIIIGLGMLILFIAVGLLRASAAFGNGTLTSLSTPAVIIATVIFTIINFGMFLIATLFAWFLPSQKDHKDKADYDKLDKEHKKMIQEIEALEERNRAIPVATMHSLKDKVTIIQKEALRYQYIQSLCKITVHKFLEEYLLRKRRERPLLS